jgi:GNAT superfamily N-acetyltransferase
MNAITRQHHLQAHAEIRPLTVLDIDEACALYRAQLMVDARLADGATRALLRRHVNEVWAKQLAKTDEENYGVALMVDGTLVGFGHISRVKARRRDNMQTYRIDALCLAAGQQNQGHEALLLQALEGFAGRAGADRIIAFVPTNPYCHTSRKTQTASWLKAGYEAQDGAVWHDFKSRACGVLLRGLQFFKMNAVAAE